MLGILSSSIRVATRENRWTHTGAGPTHADMLDSHARRKNRECHLQEHHRQIDNLKRFLR